MIALKNQSKVLRRFSKIRLITETLKVLTNFCFKCVIALPVQCFVVFLKICICHFSCLKEQNFKQVYQVSPSKITTIKHRLVRFKKPGTKNICKEFAQTSNLVHAEATLPLTN